MATNQNGDIYFAQQNEAEYLLKKDFKGINFKRDKLLVVLILSLFCYVLLFIK